MNKEFQFTGEWSSKIVLETFSILDNPEYSVSGQDTKKGVFNLEINAVGNCNPNPEIEQLNAINYLLRNQKEILLSLYNYILEVVYPDYKYSFDEKEYEEYFPEIHSPKDLKKVVGISEILILDYKKNNVAYVIITFESCWYEGYYLAIIMHQSRLIANCRYRDLSYQDILDDGGNDHYEESLSKYGATPNQFGLYLPILNDDKLKPWQKEVNERKIKNCISGNPEFIKDIISKNIIGCNDKIQYHTIMSLCVVSRNYDLTEYLLTQGCSIGNSLYYCIGRRFDKDFVVFLLNKGANINALVCKDNTRTILFSEILDLVNLLLHKNQDILDSLKRINFLIENGADLSNCNGKGDGYLELLKEHWSEYLLVKINIENIIKYLQ